MIFYLQCKLRNFKGFTLLEMIISIGIFVLVATASAVLFNQTLIAYHFTSSRMAAAREASIAMDWIVEDLRRVVYEDGRDPDQLFLTTSDDNEITINAVADKIYYHLVDDTIQRSEGIGADQLLAQHITQLDFNYYAIDNSPIPNPIGNAALVLIEITITAEVGNQKFTNYIVRKLIL